MLINLPTKRIKAISRANNFQWFTNKMATKPAGIDKKRNYVTITLCIAQYPSRNVRRILVRGVNASFPSEAKKMLKL